MILLRTLANETHLSFQSLCFIELFESSNDLLSNTELEGIIILDFLLAGTILVLSLVSLLGLFVLIQKLILRWIGSSANNEETYRTNQRSLDILFNSISLFPLLIVSYLWGAYLVTPLVETLIGYESPSATFCATYTMLITLTLLTWALHKERHRMLEENAFSKNKDTNSLSESHKQ